MMNKSKRKILFYVPLPPPVHGAALRNKSLIESKVLNEAYDITVIPFHFADSINDIGKFSIGKIIRMMSRTYTILSTMITTKPDLVYFNFSTYGFALYRDFFFTLLFKLFKVKIIFHLRTQGVKAQVSVSKFKRWLFKTAFKNIHIICLSEFLAGDISDVYEKRPFIVNNGIQDFFRYHTKADNKVPQILFLSNLSKSKGVLNLIEAFSILKAQGIEFTGLLVGDQGDLTIDQIQRELVKRTLTEEVKVLGPKYGDKKHEILSAVDIFVFPTCFEAFPGVLLEAMQFGIPVVATYEGAIPEIVDHEINGLLVQKQNSRELAEKIYTLINSHEMRMSFGQNGRRKFVENYTLEIFEGNMKNVFNKILQD